MCLTDFLREKKIAVIMRTVIVEHDSGLVK